MSTSDAITAYLDKLRSTGDFEHLVSVIPYASYLGLSVQLVGDDPITVLKAADRVIGNPVLRALHGGAVGALLETAAIFKLLWAGTADSLPKTINITVDYLRSGRPVDTQARAVITKLGRRVANVQVRAWQEDEGRPIASANAHFLLKPTHRLETAFSGT